jgi:hypothetical protein
LKQGGVIYGTGEGNTANMAEGKGDAVYKEAGARHVRNTTVGEAETFSTVNEAGWS